MANPDGTFTYTATVLPTQVKQNGSWVPVDASLVASGDGLSPRAAESQVVFSSGGSTPLATLTTPSGQSVSISWPAALPTPTVSGDTATYTDVYPGVDLQMTATVEGGYTEHLVVKNATAAANPALKDIHFNTNVSSGLTLSRTAVGGVQATDASGTVVFSSPTATMWSTPSAASTGATASVQTLSAPAAAPTGTDTTPQDATTPVTDLGVNVGNGTGLDLLPPASALTGAGVTYPVVIDPSLAPGLNNNNWMWLSQNTGVNYWQGSNNTHDTYGHVGYDDWCSDGSSGCSAFGVTRSFFSMNTSQLIGKHITGATFTVTEQGPTSSISGDRQIDLHSGGPFSSSTTWGNQSVGNTYVYSANFPSINSNTTQAPNFTPTTLIQYAADNGWTATTVVLEAHNESDDTAYRYIHGNPTLSVDFWSTPTPPTNVTVSSGGKTTACNTTGPNGTWISAEDSQSINLNATLPSPDSYSYNSTETGSFWVDKTSATAPTDTWTNPVSGPATLSSTPQPVSVPMTVVDGGTYKFQVYADNPGGYGSSSTPSGSTFCYFRVDMTAPTASVTAQQAPSSVTDTTGKITVTGADSGTNPSGVSQIVYNVGGTSLTSGGGGEQTASGSSATIPLTGVHWGTNTVWYAAVDAAGNQSAPQHWDYYLADTAYTPGTAGDLDGDGKPDLAGTDSSGNIRIYSNPLANSPDSSGAVAILNGSAPNGASFAGAIVAHNGSFSGQTCDDLVIIQAGQMSIAQNNNCPAAGSGKQPSTTWTQATGLARPSNVTGDTTNYNPTDWSSVRQAVVLPNVSTTTKPELVTLEDDNGVPTLWLMTAVGTSFRGATLLATGSSLNNLTLISPGMINGSPALWTRNATTGALTQYLNIEADTSTNMPGTTIAANGYTTGTYPTLTSSGPIGSTSSGAGTGPALWATAANNTLELITTTVDGNGNVTLAAPVQMSTSGWNGGVRAPGSFADVADWNGDGAPDILATDALGNLWVYPGAGAPGVALTGTLLGSGFTGYTFVGVADMNGDHYPDLVAEDPSGGLWLYAGDAAHDLNTPRVKIGWSWSAYSFAGLRDWNGDGKPDVVAKDSSGVLWMYPGNGDGTLGNRVQIGTSWQTYTLDGLADWNKDGHTDLIATDSNGTMWLYNGDAAHDTSGGRTSMAAGWNSQVAGLADWNGDTYPDLMALDPTGNLWLYPNTTKGVVPGPRTLVPVQW